MPDVASPAEAAAPDVDRRVIDWNSCRDVLVALIEGVTVWPDSIPAVRKLRRRKRIHKVVPIAVEVYDRSRTHRPDRISRGLVRSAVASLRHIQRGTVRSG